MEQLIEWLEYSDHPMIKPIVNVVDNENEKIKIESNRCNSFIVIWYMNRVKLDFDYKDVIDTPNQVPYDTWERLKFKQIEEWAKIYNLAFEIFRTANGFHAVSTLEPSNDPLNDINFLLKTSLHLGSDPMYALFCLLPRNRFSFRLSSKFVDDPVYLRIGMKIKGHPGHEMYREPHPCINCKESELSVKYLEFRKRLFDLIDKTHALIHTYPLYKYAYKLTPEIVMAIEKRITQF